MSATKIIGNKEILLIAERIAHEKGISREDIITAMKEGIKLAAKKKYGNNLSLECEINGKTGAIKLYNSLQVVDEKAPKDNEFNPRMQIYLEAAKKINPKIKIDEYIKEELPSIELSRVMAHVAGGEIIKKIKLAEKEKEYNQFKNREGDIISGLVSKIGIRNICLNVEGHEAILRTDDLIRGEKVKVGDRIRCYIKEVSKSDIGSQIFLSRSDPEFVVKLLEQEVPEIAEGVIEVKGVAREPGVRTKVSVYSRHDGIDVVGSCVGVRGARIQAVSSELNGEKIDIVKWSSNIAEFVINTLIPAKVSKVVVDEENGIVEAAVNEDQLSVAIGKGGQNVKLASRLIGMKVDIMTKEEESSKRMEEFDQASELFIKALDVEEIIANLLASEGYFSVEDVAEAEIKELNEIDGFDNNLSEEIKRRAVNYVNSLQKPKDVAES